VNIRFGNYSMLVRASQYGLSSQLLALLAGYGASSWGKLGDSKEKVLDEAEEEMIRSKEKTDTEDSSWG
jgi:hypothetical protein